MTSKFLVAGALSLAAVIATACQSEKNPNETSDAAGICRRDAAEALAGKDRVTDAQAMNLTGATIVRQISPGQGVTLDLRRERVTIETDPKSSRIVRAFCG